MPLQMLRQLSTRSAHLRYLSPERFIGDEVEETEVGYMY